MQNTHEYILQGSIVDTAVDTLIQRVKGLADPKMDNFNEQEMIFALSKFNFICIELSTTVYFTLCRSEPSQCPPSSKVAHNF